MQELIMLACLISAVLLFFGLWALAGYNPNNERDGSWPHRWVCRVHGHKFEIDPGSLEIGTAITSTKFIMRMKRVKHRCKYCGKVERSYDSVHGRLS